MERIKKIDFSAKVKLPLDPDDVNIRLQHFRVSEFISMIDKEALDILNEDYELIDESVKRGKQADLFVDDNVEEIEEPEDIEIDIDESDDLQRNKELWTTVQKSRFIESLMIKLPIPLFYFDGSRKPWRVVDGLQRLHTIRSFINGNFKLTGLEYLVKECEGKFFADKTMPGYLKARISEAEVIAYVINPGTPPDVKYNIFKRINTGGLKLNGQEIRNAFFRGAPANFTRDMAGEKAFTLATNYKVSGRRMIDREYANRFIAFQIFEYEAYNGKMDLFLSKAMMELYERTEFDLYEIKEAFRRSLRRGITLFEGHSFYRPKPYNQWGRQPNKALFDTMSWNLAELSDKDFIKLERRKEEFESKYRLFMSTNDLMYKAINDTTSSKTAVQNRFKFLNNFIKEFLQ